MAFMYIFHIYSNFKCVQFPDEQFFHTDYRPLIWDREHNVLDEEVCVCVCVCTCVRACVRNYV